MRVLIRVMCVHSNVKMVSSKSPSPQQIPIVSCGSLTSCFLIQEHVAYARRRSSGHCFTAFTISQTFKKVFFNDGNEKNGGFRGTVDQLCSPSLVIRGVS